MENFEEIKSHLDRATDKALEFIENHGKPWMALGSYDGVSKYNLVHQGNYLDKSRGAVYSSAEQVCRVIWNHSNKHHWDRNLVGISEIRSINQNYKVLHEEQRTNICCISNRHFVYATRYEVYGNSIYLISSSIDINIPRGAVRGQINFDFTRLERINAQETEVTRIRSYDLRLPCCSFLVNWWYGRNSMYLTDIRNLTDWGYGK